MVFSSNEFLFLYLPLSLILYFFIPWSWRNLALFWVSLIFYGWEKPTNLLIMLSVITVSYIFGALIGKAQNNAKARKLLLFAGVGINLATLGFFKYADFLLENLSRVPLFSFIRPIGIALPIGISFYVFQSISYIVDVYRGACLYQISFVDFGAYVSMYPQLIAGPIVRYSDIARELKKRKIALCDCADGAKRFVAGLAKKVLLADVAGSTWEWIENIPREQTSVLLLWLGIVFYSFQIYFDFSGYSDMAIGLGKILGFRFPENFDYPYISKSITEFWHRWHITLSSYFREYVYIPLGGNRKGTLRLVLNLFAVWLLTGLWHGADWNFVLWGTYYFALLVIEKLFLRKWLNRLPSIISHLYTLVLVVIGWAIFYFKQTNGGFHDMRSYLSGMFGMGGLPLINGEFVYTLFRNLIFVILLCLAATPLPKRLFSKIERKMKYKNKITVFDVGFNALIVLVFALCIVYISSSDYRPNIYFEF